MFLSLMLLGAGPLLETAASQDTAQVVTLSLRSLVYHNNRSIRIYLPPDYHRPGNVRVYPVLLMTDGFAVFSPRGWNGPAIVDSLIRAGAVEPFILVGIDNAASIPGVPDPGAARAREYLPYADPDEPASVDPQGTRFPDMLWNEVTPLVRSRFRTDTMPERIALGGASYGAIAMTYTATVIGRRFGGLLLESPPLFLFQERLIDEFLSALYLPQRLYVGIGTAETSDTAVLNRGDRAIRRFVIAADARRLSTRVNRVEGAMHDSRAWRDRLPAALEFLFPPRGRAPGSQFFGTLDLR